MWWYVTWSDSTTTRNTFLIYISLYIIIIITPQKIKAVVQDSTTGALRDPISMQDVLTAIRKQTGVVLHEAFIKVPPGRTAQQLINQLGDHELPANILFPNDQEAVIRVHVIARPTKASKGPAVEEGGVAEEASASSAPTAE